MGDKGSAHGRFQRGLDSRNLLAAEAAARELRRVSLGDALSLVVLIGERDPRRYSRAAARWAARFVLEHGVELDDARLTLAALAALGRSEAAADVLAELGARYRIPNFERAFRRARLRHE